jgi:hypothetical protein
MQLIFRIIRRNDQGQWQAEQIMARNDRDVIRHVREKYAGKVLITDFKHRLIYDSEKHNGQPF